MIKRQASFLSGLCCDRIWLGAWREGLTWNHAKIIAVDGKHLLTGGHNLWDAHYLKNDPVRDISTQLEGPVAVDGHKFLDEQWKYVMRMDQESQFFHLIPDMLSFVKGHRVGVSHWPPGRSTEYPPLYGPVVFKSLGNSISSGITHAGLVKHVAWPLFIHVKADQKIAVRVSKDASVTC